MFNQDIRTTYDLKDATLEIIIMLLVAFLLGYLLHYFLSKKPESEIIEPTDNSVDIMLKLGKTQAELNTAIREKADIKKALSIEHNQKIEELRLKLANARADLDQCLASKADGKIILSETSKTLTNTDNLNDLKIIEGIGTALEKILNLAGINSFEELSGYDETSLRQILSDAGSRFKVHNPSSWPQQAKLAAEGNWDALKVLQERLNLGL